MVLMLIMTALESFSQGSSDTINVNRTKFINALNTGLEGKVCKEQRDLLLMANDTLKARIAIKDGIILNLNAQISDFKNIIKSHESIGKTKDEQRTLLEQQLAEKDKEIKKQRRGKKAAAFIGIIVTVVSGYLYITK